MKYSKHNNSYTNYCASVYNNKLPAHSTVSAGNRYKGLISIMHIITLEYSFIPSISVCIPDLLL